MIKGGKSLWWRQQNHSGQRSPDVSPVLIPLIACCLGNVICIVESARGTWSRFLVVGSFRARNKHSRFFPHAKISQHRCLTRSMQRRRFVRDVSFSPTKEMVNKPYTASRISHTALKTITIRVSAVCNPSEDPKSPAPKPKSLHPYRTEPRHRCHIPICCWHTARSEDHTPHRHSPASDWLPWARRGRRRR